MNRADSLRNQNFFTRRGFSGASAATVAVSLCASTIAEAAAPENATDLNLIGPRSGYSTEIGTCVSMLTWMREANGVLRSCAKITPHSLVKLSQFK
jgi:hypothetical protein